MRHVVLDRDGVLNRELASGWLADPADWRWEPGALEGLRELARAGRRVSVVTNQSGIGRGVVSRRSVEKLHDWLRRELESAGAPVAKIIVCPHAPEDGCECRKPRPGMVREAVLESGVAAAETLLVGDDLRDLEAGLSAGVRVALVRTGKGESVRSGVPAGTPVFDDLLAVARWVVGEAEPGAGGAGPWETAVIREAFDEHASLHAEAAEALVPALREATALAEAALAGGGKLLALGNGGSAAQSQHLAAELVVRFVEDRRALPAVALSTDTSALTAAGNDFGFEHVFERQVDALARAGDCVVALSTSGNSENVLRAVKRAREKGCSTIGLTGRGGGALAGMVDVLLAVPSETTARIQEYHQICIHVLAGWLEERLG